MLIKKVFGLSIQMDLQKRYKSLSLLSPRVIDGSSIVVSREKDQEPFDSTEYAKELTSILANLAQVISIVLIAARG